MHNTAAEQRAFVVEVIAKLRERGKDDPLQQLLNLADRSEYGWADEETWDLYRAVLAREDAALECIEKMLPAPERCRILDQPEGEDDEYDFALRRVSAANLAAAYQFALAVAPQEARDDGK